ncbi:MAG: SpaA isopeptide-forming pilin-related protein [Coriobacteriia bacterium]|nr:SpaA isopeptide-forming pilin-related protein [Coriobacteriia bacterium]
MTNTLWSKTRGGSSGTRLFAAYLALALVVAMVGPGLSVFAAEGHAGDGEAPVEAVPVEPVIEAPVVIVEEPVAEKPEFVAEEPVVEVAALESLEVPVVTVAAAAATVVALTAPIPTPDDSNWICAGGVKLDENPRTGTYTWDTANTEETPTTPSDYSITITTYPGPDGAMLMDFTSNYPVAQVKVKGSDGALFYNYSPAVTSATGLHAPVNASGKYADISHIVFCFGTIVTPETGDLDVFKYLDANENESYDDGEEMLAGWEFSLYDDEDALVGSGSTDALGKLSFTGLTPGDYYVTETLKPGWENTTLLTQSITVLGDGTVELWFGNIETVLPPTTGDLIIYKFEDDNRNGVHDPGEAMLAGWEFTVTLESPPILDVAIGASAIMPIGSGLTDGAGELEFLGLLPDTYTVTETPQPGWDNVTPLVQTVEVVAGQTAEVWFGNVPQEEEPETGGLIIYKYNDLNRNGVHDFGEPMLEDWEFTVTRAIDGQLEVMPSAIAVIGSGLTDEYGELYFGGLWPGEYTVTETPQEGWDNITPLVQTVQVVVGEDTEVWFGNAEEFLPFSWLDLAITKMANRETATEGALITYTLTYWNNGNIPAENYTIVDDFDERYVSVVNANGGVVSGGKITWTFSGPLTQEAGKQTLTYTVRVSANMPTGTTNVDNTVVISHPRDEDSSNNTARERVVVSVVASSGEPFLPFTGGDYTLLFGFAVAIAALGLLLRSRTDTAA